MTKRRKDEPMRFVLNPDRNSTTLQGLSVSYDGYEQDVPITGCPPEFDGASAHLETRDGQMGLVINQAESDEIWMPIQWTAPDQTESDTQNGFAARFVENH